jgi:hydroxymethylpyrimidine pyrophosphatase-like HAD family hydrolase
VRFNPKVMVSLDGLTSDVAKLVGVSDDLDAIATIGDMPNDVQMFAHSGLSIAMGNASPELQRAARRITTSNAEEGFATAVDRFILPPN